MAVFSVDRSARTAGPVRRLYGFCVGRGRWVAALAVVLVGMVSATQKLPAFKIDKSSAAAKALESKIEKVSYALGVNLAGQLKAQLIEVDPDVLMRGLRDALSGSQTLLTDVEVRAAVKAVQEEARTRRTALQRAQVRLRQDGAAKDRNTPADAPARLIVWFKLDPRLATGVYGGERWVAPPSYTQVGQGTTCTIEAKALDLDNAKWTATDPAMVSITPGKGGNMKIVVQRAGESRIHINSQGLVKEKELTVKAEFRNHVLQVEISQS